jgi:hypothetical protein
MAVQGSTVVDFGAFPGKIDANVAVTGQSGISGANSVEAWISPTATSDHSADEHLLDAPIVLAGNIVAATGFTIYAVASDRYRLHGQWTVAWVWN